MIEEQFIEYVVKQLVDHPDDVRIERTVDDKGTLLKLYVHADDLGRVIGKHGATAQSLRGVLRALGTKNNDHYNLKIVNVDQDGSTETESTVTENGDETVRTEEVIKKDSAGKVESVEKSESETVENESALAKKTREELADLDDLDI